MLEFLDAVLPLIAVLTGIAMVGWWVKLTFTRLDLDGEDWGGGTDWVPREPDDPTNGGFSWDPRWELAYQEYVKERECVSSSYALAATGVQPRSTRARSGNGCAGRVFAQF